MLSQSTAFIDKTDLGDCVQKIWQLQIYFFAMEKPYYSMFSYRSN